MVLQLLGAAAGAFAGNGIDSIFNKAAADQNYEYERRLQKHDQEFQKEMRATAYQTTVEDMQKAGINPAVALSGGASQSQGGSSSHGSVSMQGASGSNVAETAMNLKSAQAQIDNQTALTSADVGLKQAQALKTIKEAGYTDQQIKNATKEYELIQEQIQKAKTERERLEAQKKLEEWNARHPVLEKILPGAPGLTAAVGAGLMAGPIGSAVGSKIYNHNRKMIGFNR